MSDHGSSISFIIKRFCFFLGYFSITTGVFLIPLHFLFFTIGWGFCCFNARHEKASDMAEKVDSIYGQDGRIAKCGMSIR